MAGRCLALGALLCAAECFAPVTRHAACRPRQLHSTLSPPEADEACADAAREAAVEAALAPHVDGVARALAASPRAVCVVDGVLGDAACRAMRAEAEAIRRAGRLEDCASSGDVRATQVCRGDPGLSELCPRLTAYTLALARALGAAVNARAPAARLRADGAHTNKLAVCELDGAAYAKHVDNNDHGGALRGDARKLTALYYCNPDWCPEYGGEFRAFDAGAAGVVWLGTSAGGTASPPASGDGGATTTIAPVGDRLVVFWSDELVHDVLPARVSATARGGGSVAAAEQRRHRWALTVWFVTTDPMNVRPLDPLVEARHFGSLASAREDVREAGAGVAVGKFIASVMAKFM